MAGAAGAAGPYPAPMIKPDRAASVMSALRDGTRASHTAVEDTLRLPDRVNTRADLAAVLSALLRCWEPLERTLADRDWCGTGLDRHMGEAAGLIHEDLAALGARAAPGTGCRVEYLGTAEAIGGRYVLLGSALGGRIIAPGIERRLGLAPAEGTRFFRRHDMDPGRDWATFRRVIDSIPWTPTGSAAAVDAARRTFGAIRTTVARTFLA